MSHYFQNDNNLMNDYHYVNYTYKDNEIRLLSNSGVFSKDRIDFGTNLLLNSIPSIKSNKSLIDVGCGIGVIAISLKKANPKIDITLVDVNDRCTELAVKNLNENHIQGKVILSSLYENVNDSFDYVISNPPIRAGKQIVFGVIDGAFTHLNKDGEIYVVIQKKQGKDSLLKHMEDVFGNVSVVNKDKGYFILMSKKMN